MRDEDMRGLKFSICLYLVFVFLAAGFLVGVRVASAPDASEFVPGEVIVGFEKITVDVREAVEARGGDIVKEISVLKTLVVKVTVNEEDFIQSMSSIPGFRYAERNGLVQAAYTPSDPYWGYQWNMRTIEADKAWDIHKGFTSVVVAVVDTGVDYNHKDLAAHYVSGGYDWVNNDNDPWDDNYHGTHCAGIAAAVMDNDVGVVGVAQCSIWAEKVLDYTGYGGWDDLASGIIHATDNGVDIISMSLGGYDYSSLVDSACTYAWNNGVLLVAAAGNDNENIDVHKFYPASFETVIAVSATTSSDVRWSGSNYGNTIELAAPGARVPSTLPGNSYGYLTGTSMACPHVAGVAALAWSHNQSLTNIQLRTQLHTAVDDLGNPGKDVYYGYGRVNAFKALTGSIDRSTQIVFSFSPNPALPGQTVTLSGTLKGASANPVFPAQVKVEYSTNGGVTWNYIWTLNANAAGQFSTSFTAPGVGTYLVRVSYAGSAAYGSSSNTQTFTVQTGGKVNTQIVFSFSPNPALPGQTVTLSGTLKGASANPVFPAQVKVEYSTNGGVTWNYIWTLNTNTAGQFSKTFAAPGAGTYLVGVSYDGSASYNPSSQKATLKIQ